MTQLLFISKKVHVQKIPVTNKMDESTENGVALTIHPPPDSIEWSCYVHNMKHSTTKPENMISLLQCHAFGVRQQHTHIQWVKHRLKEGVNSKYVQEGR